MSQPTFGRIGVALYGDLTFDSRVRREVETLAGAGLEVSVACLAAPADLDMGPNVRILAWWPDRSTVVPGAENPFFAMPRRGPWALVGRIRWLVGYLRNLRAWGSWAVTAVGRVDAWHAHDLTGLVAVGSRLPRTKALVYDAHELFLETGTALKLPAPARALLRAAEGRLVRRSALVVTVNAGLEEVLRRRYRPRATLVVHNAPPPRAPDRPRGDELRAAAAIPAKAPIVLYHGALSANRGVEQLMAAMREPGLERAHLCLLGFGELADTYRAAAGEPSCAGRVHVLEPVSPAVLLDWIASADVGAMPIQAATMNLRLSTPNKLFECLAAATPVVASDFPAMRSIIVDDPDGPLGRTCDPTEAADIARALREILDLDDGAQADLRARCQRAAVLRWNWASQAKPLVEWYAGFLGRKRPAGIDPGQPLNMN